MNKKLTVIVPLIALSLSLTSCFPSKLVRNINNNESEYSESKDQTMEESKTEQEKEDNKEDTNNKKETVELKQAKKSYEKPDVKHKFETEDDFWVIIGDKEIQLPAKAENLLPGWKTSDEKEEIGTNEYMDITYKKDGYNDISVSVYNDTSSTIKAKDGKIYSLKLKNPDNSKKTLDIRLPKNIGLGSTYRDIVNAYGEPSANQVSESIRVPNSIDIKYEVSKHQKVELQFNGNEVYFIIIECIK